MKKLFIFTFILLASVTLFSQNNPYWIAGGNTNAGADAVNATNNILGTSNNFPMRIITGNTQRIWINENKTPTINGHTFARNGYVGIGSNAFNVFTDPNRGPFSLLHLNGGNGGLQVQGHHDWMRTGITITDNDDLAYVGLRALDAGNINEFTMTWSNNPNTPAGPDDIMEAQLLFYDMNGRIIKQVDITDRGESKLTVYGNNLEKGIYTYSLIADGKLIATKKMVKQ